MRPPLSGVAMFVYAFVPSCSLQTPTLVPEYAKGKPLKVDHRLRSAISEGNLKRKLLACHFFLPKTPLI